MPCFAVFTKVGLSGAQRLPAGATALSVREYTVGAIAEFPIAHGRFRNVYQECHTSCEDADESSSYPSLAGLKR